MKKIKRIKRRFLVLGTLLSLCFSLGSHVYAVEENDYKSNGSVGFYGEYVFPDEEKPSVPNVPDGPSNPSGGNTTSNNKPISHLPQTGEQKTSVWIAVIGSLLILLRILLIFKKRKEEV